MSNLVESLPRVLLVLLSAFLCAFIIAACGSGGNANGAAGDADIKPVVAANAGSDSEAVPDVDLVTNFALPSLTGETVSLESLRGQYVLVNFWATWCIPCRKEMPYLQEISEKHREQLVILGVNMNEEAERVQPFINDMGITFPVLLEPTEEMQLEHEVRGLPVSFVVGPDGAMIYRRVGEILPNEFDAWLAENLLAESSP